MAFFVFRASASGCLGISHPALGEEEEESSCQWQKGAWSGRCWKIWVHLPGHFQKKKKTDPIHPSIKSLKEFASKRFNRPQYRWNNGNRLFIDACVFGKVSHHHHSGGGTVGFFWGKAG